jgi:hypothetical protein
VRTVPALATTSIDTRAFFAQSWRGGWVIATQGRHVLVVGSMLETIRRVDVGSTPKGVTMSSTGAMLVASLDDSLTAFEILQGAPKWSVRGNFLACHAFVGGVWGAEHCGSEIEISMRDDSGGAVRGATRIVDPFGGSHVMFLAHPNDRSIVVWVAAGQDGQTAFLATRSGSAIHAVELPPRDRLPPIFLPDGSSYLSAGDEALERFRWPGAERVDAVAWPMLAGEDGDEQSGSDVQLLPGGFATWCSNHGRIRIIDLETGRIVDELSIDGHPVRTVEDLYPNLRGDRTPCSDFEYATPGPGGLMLTVHGSTQLVVSAITDWSPDPKRVTG